MRGAPLPQAGNSLTAIAAALALAASLLSGLAPAAAAFAAAAIFLLAVPVLEALHLRLQSLPALLCATGLLLVGLLGLIG